MYSHWIPSEIKTYQSGVRGDGYKKYFCAVHMGVATDVMTEQRRRRACPSQLGQ
jgi:hypothetical protein